MRYLSKRFISILLSFTFVAISLVLYVNFIKPTYSDIKTDQGRLVALEEKNQQYKDVFIKLKGTLEDLKKSPDLQNRVSMVFPLSANTSDSLNQLTSIASANGLVISNVDVVEAPIVPAVNTGKVGTVSIIKGVGVLKNTIRVSGSYEQVKAFLQGVESGVRISSIHSLKITKNANLTNQNTFSATLEVETYYQANQ